MSVSHALNYRGRLMHSEAKQPRFQHYLQNKFLYLLISLLLLVAFSPLAGGRTRPGILGEILFTVLMFSGIWAVSREKYYTIIAVILALPMLVSMWLTHWMAHKAIILTSDFFSCAFLLYTILIILGFIFRESEVTIDIIFAAIVVYLLMGVMWGFFYSGFEVLSPGSVSSTHSSPGTYAFEFVYFSFVTLTTLGYGDVTPLSAAAKSFAILEAIIGQMYIAVLIARLVGIYTVQMTRMRDNNPK
jgi:voltage-gated potassium channel Kch